MRSEQISSILRAECKQLLINNAGDCLEANDTEDLKTRPHSQPQGGNAAQRAPNPPESR